MFTTFILGINTIILILNLLITSSTFKYCQRHTSNLTYLSNLLSQLIKELTQDIVSKTSNKEPKQTDSPSSNTGTDTTNYTNTKH